MLIKKTEIIQKISQLNDANDITTDLLCLILRNLPSKTQNTIINQVWGMVYFALSQNEAKE